jgi:regulator of RNase E activity RraA
MSADPPAKLFAELMRLDTCSVSNAMESLGVRLRNEGFVGPGITCRTPGLPPMVGMAVTLKVHSSEPPMKPGFYLGDSRWWEQLGESHLPRVLVVQDEGADPGRGALVGPVHACILRALGFTGVVTTGSLRGVDGFAESGLHGYSASLSPSHAYCHVVETGAPVEVAGARIETGSILHGDSSGIVVIPRGEAERIPDAAVRYVERERAVCEYCASRDFTLQGLRDLIRSWEPRP